LITDIHAIGLNTAQGLNFTEPFYWDMNEGTREFSNRFQKRMKGQSMPTMMHAGVYSSLLHYFKALEALGGNSDDGIKIVEKMKSLPTEDVLFGKGVVQPNGRKIHPAYLFEVKAPSESKKPWDYYKLVATIPAEEAFMPLSESTCPLLKK
jgi:branched-chain amino acid transport system substrate-binding protein